MADFQNELNKLKESDTYRQIPNISEKDGEYVVINDEKLLNLSSNDYLNISTNENLAKEFMKYFCSNPQCQFSSASARLLSGSTSV